MTAHSRSRLPWPLRWLRALLLVVGLLYLLIFLVVPFFAMRMAEQWYSEQGEGHSLLIGGWTLSPLSGEIALTNVEASYPIQTGTGQTSTDSRASQQADVGAEQVAINLNLSALFDKTVHVQSIGIHGLRFRGAQSADGLSLAGVELANSTEAEPEPAVETTSENDSSDDPLAGWTIQVDDIHLADDRVRWQQDNLSLAVRLDELRTGQFISSSEENTPISLNITLESLELALPSANEEDGAEPSVVRLAAPITLTLNAQAAQLLSRPTIEGSVALSALAIEVPGVEQLQFSELELRGVQFAMLEEGMMASLEGLILNNIKAQLPEQDKAQLDQLMISALRWRSAEDDLSINQIQLSGVSANVAAMAQVPDVGLESITTTGLQVSNLSTELSANLHELAANGFHLVHPEAGHLSLGALGVSEVAATPTTQDIGVASINNLVVRPTNDEPMVSLAHYEIAGISLTPDSLTMGVHRFYGLLANATRLADGSIKGVPASASPADDAEADNAEAAADSAAESVVSGAESVSTPDRAIGDANDPSAPFNVTIAGMELVDNEQRSSVTFNDQGVTPAVTTQVQLLTLRTGRIATQALDQGIDLDVVLALDDYNRIRANGKMGVKGEYPEGQLNFSIEQMNLVEFNPYLVQAMGYRLKKGMLGVTSDIKITDGQLGGKLNILLQNSKFEPADDEAIDRLSKQISMPVETALSILKDDNNNIRIEVPLSGDLSQPDVGINDVVNQISRKALKTATLYYLKQSMVPYGQLISLASFAGDQLFAIRLNDLNFEPNVVELNDEQRAYLDTVSEMMRKKAALELQVCPIASKAEATQWGDGWASEVNKRAAAVKAYLAPREDKNGKPLSGRITLCTPKQGEKAQIILGV